MNNKIKHLIETILKYGLFDDDIFNDDNDILSDLNVAEKFNDINYIDLGLPSGTLWADRNLGAYKPSDSGLLFAWGETEGYQLSSNHFFDFINYKFADTTVEGGKYYPVIKKYCVTHRKNYSNILDNNIDKIKQLLLEDDAAYKFTNGESKIPSIDQWQELLSNCNSEYAKINGISGMLFRSKINDNTIFFPFVGFQLGVNVISSTNRTYLWSNELAKRDSTKAILVLISRNGSLIDNNKCYSDNRCNGYPIRSVMI